jgi:Rap1a immunity proteins
MERGNLLPSTAKSSPQGSRSGPPSTPPKARDSEAYRGVPLIYEVQGCGYGRDAMLNTRAIATVIAILLSVEPNIATSSTVGDLLKYCSSSLNSPDYSYCLGVMDGAEGMAIMATVFELMQHHNDPSLDICFDHPPPDPGTLADSFVSWARSYPTANNWDEASGLVAAFRAKWPCGSIGR